MHLPWSHPYTAIIAGPTMSGKSQFVFRFLKHLDVMIDCKIHEIIWCHGANQPLHAKIKEAIKTPIKFIEGLITLDEIAPEIHPPNRLVIIDDLMRSLDGSVVDLFSKGCHHKNISVIFITQNIFHQGRGSRDVSLNSHYIVLFKNPRDSMQIYAFARQIYPTNAKFILSAYSQATQKAHSYLLFDFKQNSNDLIRFRTNIFPDDKENIIYMPCEKGEGENMFIEI